MEDVTTIASTVTIGMDLGDRFSHSCALDADGSVTCFHERAAEFVPAELRAALSPLLTTLAGLSATIKEYEKQIEKLSRERYPETKLLRQVCGVGPVTALCFVLTLEDPKRIQSSRMVGAFLGLRPRQNQSGQRDPELRITKAGDRDLRRLLVQSAQYILGPFGTDSDLRRWGLALAARGGKNAKKRAVVALARKLAVLLHRLLVTGEVYEPLRNTHIAREDEDSVGSLMNTDGSSTLLVRPDL
jgi:transposase